jgi:predicted  nucleic acid-binding Zn-ribbon protein
VRETLRTLWELHRVDQTLERLASDLAALPEAQAGLDRTEAELNQRVSTAREALEGLQLELRQAEASLRDSESHKVHLEGQQNQVKTNEAYTALLHEIEAAAQAISDSETRSLELMEGVEETRRALANAERELESRGAEIQQERQALEIRGEGLSAEQAQAQEERARVAAGLEAGALRSYERILTRRRPAIALVQKEVCMGCRVGIPSQRFMDVLDGKNLVMCGGCRRILILPRILDDDTAPQ